MHEEIMALAKKHDRSIGALGARRGLQSETACRSALAGILEQNFGVQVMNIDEYDEEGVVFGRPDRVEAAAAAIELDKAETRALIDRQLRDRGWEADTETLRYANRVRPVKGRCLAIAEWPTAAGNADMRFIGLQCVGVVEAKRQRKLVSP